VAEWARVYRDELVAMDSISLLDDRRARTWNRHVDRMQRAHLELRKSLEGRAAITAMISDRVRTVAHWSAAHALFWDEDLARAYLLAEAASQGVGSFDAQMTLREFDAGRLRMEWQPKRG
jgi:hypothetical protein